MTSLPLFILMGLMIKHFLFDYIFQYQFMYENKGKYLHPGGIIHAVFHGFGTFMIFGPFDINIALVMGIIDMLVHYHVDYIKTLVSDKFGYGPQDKPFWMMFGFDQLLHHLTYLALVWVFIR